MERLLTALVRPAAAKERLGVDYVRPAADLLIALTGARDLAVRAAADDAAARAALTAQTASVRRALAAVAAADARLGGELGTTRAWTELRGAVEGALGSGASGSGSAGAPASGAADPTAPAASGGAEADVAASPRTALRTWSELTAQAAALVVAAGDGSDLILDPDLDSYYVMNALVVTVPTLLDSSGHAAALGSAVAERASAATGQVALSTQQTTASAQQIGASAHELAQTADELRELVGRFRLE